MPKKQYILSIVSLLFIPLFTLLSIRLINSIDPEMAVHSSNYERNFRLLTMAKNFSMLGVLLINMGLWFLTCFFLIKSKKQPYRWLLLTMLGPVGLMILTMLADKEPTPGDSYQRFVGNLKIALRVVYELFFFVGIWIVAYQVIVLKRNLLIMFESAHTGMSTAQIMNIQNASSGMWAFGEGLETMALATLFYLLWPICFNAVGNLLRKSK